MVENVEDSKPRGEILIRRRRETEFPGDLEGRVEAISSAFNISCKTSTFLLLGESLIDPHSLTGEFRAKMGRSEMSGVSFGTAPAYCHHTLCPIGLVAEELRIDYFGAEQVVGFRVTPDGKKYRAVGALFIDFEQKNKFSLFPVLGSTNKRQGDKHRAPLTRIKILKALTGGGKRQVDLCRELEISSGVAHQSVIMYSLVALDQAGAIEYTSVKPQTGKVQVSYSLADKPIPYEEVQAVSREPAITRKIAEIAKELGEGNQEITQAKVFSALPVEFRERWQEKNLRMLISHILLGLARQGFLKRGQFKGGEIQSFAKLTPKGRLILNELILPLEDALSDGPTLQRLNREVLPRVLANLEQYSEQTANLYYPYSRSKKIKETSLQKDRARSILSQNLKGLSTQELSQQLELHTATTYLYLQQLVEEGLATRSEPINGVIYYFPVKPPVEDLKVEKELKT